jgi:two-component system, OmpR family, sensor histidine kinase TctE
MHEPSAARESIRRRLLAFLFPSLLMLVVGAAFVTYRVALQSANAAYDRALLDPMVDLAENIKTDADGAHLDLSIQSQQALLYDQSDRLFFQIRAPGGDVIAGLRDLPVPSPIDPARKSFFDAVYEQEPVRIAAMQTSSGYVVLVAETLNKRHRLIREILASVLIPTLLIALVSIGLALLGVARGLAPLERIRHELLDRSPQDLRPVDDRPVPAELTSVVGAFNRVLGRLRSATEMQQRFLANAAHQLRTPLAGLQMHLELLLRRELSPEVKEEVAMMHLAMTRASRLARQLLALAKAESANSDSLSLKEIDLREIAHSTAADWVHRAVERDIDLGFSLQPALAVGDPVLLREMLNNLVDNALRYTPPGGVVTVRSGPSGDMQFLGVDDTGPGIPESARDRVFERFYRIDETDGEGSGLGLAIVKEVVERHGARLSVETPPAGHGTRIVVLFPSVA